MPPLCIFCDAHLDSPALHLLRQGVAPHHLIISDRPEIPPLSPPPTDPTFFQADLALGQIAAADVMKSDRLAWFQVTSAGFTRYDTATFRAHAHTRGLKVSTSSSVYQEPCAEHILAFMLAQARQLPQTLGTRHPLGSPEWNHLRHLFCLTGQTVVILGFGAIGSRLIELLTPFRMNIIAMRRHPAGQEGVSTVTPHHLADALSQADHVVNILPANDASTHFVNAALLAQIKPGAVFYNIGRGTTVQQDDLASSLSSGHLAAAWLDVTDPEPLPDGHPLLYAPNCFITPHLGGCHRHEQNTLVQHFLDNLARHLKNEPLLDQIM